MCYTEIIYIITDHCVEVYCDCHNLLHFIKYIMIIMTVCLTLVIPFLPIVVHSCTHMPKIVMIPACCFQPPNFLRLISLC
jgi:hypothetical protein